MEPEPGHLLQVTIRHCIMLWFINISRYIDSNANDEIHGYIQNFMLYKMIYFSSHKFELSNLCFSPFYEHFRQLREKYAFELKIKYIMLIGSLSSYDVHTYDFFQKNHSTPPTPLTYSKYSSRC